MLRFYCPIGLIGGITALVACSGGSDPVADQANNAAAGPAEVDVLPPDESVATPTDELENGAVEDQNSAGAAGETGKIPASFQGRWALTPADCTSTRGDAKGLLIVNGDGMRFYESVARPAGPLEATANSVSGQFAFTGEGMSWKRHQSLQITDHKLVRTESKPMASYTYARCTS